MPKIEMESSDLKIMRDTVEAVDRYLLAQTLGEQTLYLLEEPRVYPLAAAVANVYHRLDGLWKEYLVEKYQEEEVGEEDGE